MNIFPAIDLKQGKCVRLFKGDMNQATIFNESPASQAQEFELAGFKFLHLVDLDGAIEGRSINKQAVLDILSAVKFPVQLGGGIRTLSQIEDWLSLGISRVILGTVALKNPQIVIEACKKFPNKIVVGIDARNGFVATEGWVETGKIKALDLAKKFEDVGVSAIIYTDISRDGALTGFDFEGTKELAKSLKIPVIASGGVASIIDVKKVSEIEQFGVEGMIIGRALYEKKIKIEELQEFL
jgi:phosphoribosylformimino-5-aminoimidazole carboxamide ribotide isomerase